MRADELMEAGDMEGRAVWLRIVKAIEELLSEERPETRRYIKRRSSVRLLLRSTPPPADEAQPGEGREEQRQRGGLGALDHQVDLALVLILDLAHVLAVAIQERALLYGHFPEQNVADHAGALGHGDGAGLDLAVDTAIDANGIDDDLALDGGALADEQSLGADVAVDGTIDLDLALAAQVADDTEIGADDRGRRRLSGNLGRRLIAGLFFTLEKHGVLP